MNQHVDSRSSLDRPGGVSERFIRWLGTEDLLGIRISTVVTFLH